MQVMRAGLHGHRKSLGARSAQFRKCKAGREMNNVQPKTVFSAQGKHQPNRCQLRLIRPRLKIGRITIPIGISQNLRRAINRARQLRMHQQRQAAPGNRIQCRSQLLLRNHGEPIYPRIDQKTFEPRHSSGRESFDLILIIVNHSAPSRPIDTALAVCGRALSLKRSYGSGRRKAIQRHIDQQRIASRSRRSRSGFKTLPLRAPGIIDVHMGIDQPRKNGRVAKIVDRATRRNFIDRNNRLNTFAFHQYGRRANSFRCDDTASDKGLRTQNANSSTRKV